MCAVAHPGSGQSGHVSRPVCQWDFGKEKRTKSVAIRRDFRSQSGKNVSAAGAPLRTQLGELTALQRPPAGLRGRPSEGSGGKGKGGEGAEG